MSWLYFIRPFGSPDSILGRTAIKSLHLKENVGLKFLDIIDGQST